jgi:hypothetical protein
MFNSRRGYVVLIGIAMLFAASAAWAETLPGPGIPDALYLDIVTAPGYLWMNGCGEMGAAKSQPAASDAHAGHHPGQATPAVAEVFKFPSEVERELTELSLALARISNSLYWGK